MRLKKLILSGFKSFADRTEFEFDEGITCVVGPNGCGKSNIVDAFKWVLGEQSAKSLRGTEMLDVIFNGSSKRRPSGSAQVTLVFDNSSGMVKLGDDDDSASAELSISRRLFRSGQSEYLVNKQPARLKDIREMFLDTGIGMNAYNLIEQGRVEAFLQAGHDERRAIFDEAAGISKYKARKKEALRKLDRVEQNLLRVNDILQEVEKRLRSIKYQAGKARNYQTYTQELSELRSIHFLAQYHKRSYKRKELQEKLDSANDSLSAINAQIDKLEANRSGTEVELVDLERTSRQLQSRLAAKGGQITTCQERAEMLTARVKELGDQIVSVASRCEEQEAKMASVTEDIETQTHQLEQIDSRVTELNQLYEAVREEHTSGQLAITHLQAQLEDEKAGTIDIMRRTASLHNEIQGLKIRQENLHGQKNRLSERAGEIDESIQQTLTKRAQFDAKLGDVKEVLDASHKKLEETKKSSQTVIDTENKLQNELFSIREQRSATASRIEAICEMQKRLEGIGSGVKRVLEAKNADKLQCVRGILGEFIQTDIEHALVVEAALAGADQHLIVEKSDELIASQADFNEVLGENSSVEILCLDRLETFKDELDISRQSQIVARVVDWVKFDAWLSPAIWRLLGKTLIVESLSDAFSARQSLPGGFRFVTSTGEVLEADGRVRLGSASRGAGVITRQSELAELESRQLQLENRIGELDELCKTKHDEREHLEKLQQSLRTAIYEANTERVECESKLQQLDEQISSLKQEKPLIAEDIKELSQQIESAVNQEHQAKDKSTELEQLNAQRQASIEKLNEQIASASQRQEELATQITEHKVSLAQVEEKKRSIRDALIALRRQSEHMLKDIETGRAEIELNRSRRTDAEESIKGAGEETDRLYAELEKLNREAEEAEESRRGLSERLEEIRSTLSQNRKSQTQANENVNSNKLELGEVDVRIENLITRASDEMGMNILDLYQKYEHDEDRDWQAVSDQIQQLRQKIERLGNVNLDAISEQEELEKRREFLTSQLEDIDNSQKQLTELIRKINKESRELFIKTFEDVRNNFRELFRKLFGGGRADILLLDPEDVLECGIEIVARPPGKELRNMSLLSGGEKTMTALAMLFSIFRSRPSPFCLLDEVDAALDETNNERFNRLLKDFVSTSQFLMISHAKRTMSMASVLYGVTMQEPGVSKRISVRFEDAGHNLDKELEPVGA